MKLTQLNRCKVRQRSDSTKQWESFTSPTTWHKLCLYVNCLWKNWWYCSFRQKDFHQKLNITILETFYMAATWSRRSVFRPFLSQTTRRFRNKLYKTYESCSIIMSCIIAMVLLEFNKYFRLHLMLKLWFPESVMHNWAKWLSVT